MMNKNIKIIDTHFHIWDSEKLSLLWLDDFKSSLNPNYTLNDYKASIKDSHIVSSCYEEVDVIKKQSREEALMAVSLCEDPGNQVAAATIGCDLSSPNFKAYIELFAKEKCVRSVRHNFFAADPSISRDALFINNTQRLGELNILCDLVMSVDNIQIGIDLVHTCPNTTFVINHCGMCPFDADLSVKEHWKAGITEYAKHKNTLCKISESGFLSPEFQWEASDVADIIKHCVDSFGEQRIIYGSNWPVCEITSTVDKWIEAVHLSLKDAPHSLLDNLFYNNAKKYYLDP